MKTLIGSPFLYKLFTSGIESSEHLLIRRLILLNAFLLIGVFTFSTFTMMNTFVSHSYGIALLDASAAAIFAATFIDLRYSKKIRRAIFIASTALSLFMVLFVSVNQNQNFGMIWTIFVPIFVISLYGHSRGLLISAVYYLVIFSLAYDGLSDWQQTQWDTVALSRFVIASCVLVFVVFITEYAFDKLQRELNELSVTDPLTKLFNRRKIDAIITAEIAEARRYDTELSLAILDVDDFKAINDTFGHPVGDEVLIELAELLRRRVREVDAVGRWGGEEFVIVLPKTSLEEARRSMERLRERISSHRFGTVEGLSCSFGVCNAARETLDKQHLITCADDALYEAKRAGKDRVVTRAA